MSYTIVYDRRFLRCGEKYIPMCLYGDNNVTEKNYRTGREVRARDWSTFIYSDDMILGTEAEILSIVRKYHPENSTEHISGVQFHGKFLNDQEMFHFFKNGIAGAITLEDLLMQTSLGSINGKLSVYDAEAGYDSKLSGATAYLHSSSELEAWVQEAKNKKAEIIQRGKEYHVYIQLGFDYYALPLQVTAFRDRTSPVIAYGKKSGRKSRSYVKSFTGSSTSYTLNFSEAFIFDNIDDAYLRLPKWAVQNLYFCDASKAEQHAEREPGKYVLSAQYMGSRVYIYQKYRTKIAFTRIKGNDLKRFQTERMALKWFEEKIHAAQPLFTNPAVEEL